MADPPWEGGERLKAREVQPACPLGLRCQGFVGEDRARLELGGELDLAAREEAELALHALEAEQPRELILDLSELDFINSAGLVLVLEAGRRARMEGRRVKLLRGTRAVRRTFEMTGLDAHLEWVSDEGADGEEALYGALASPAIDAELSVR